MTVHKTLKARVRARMARMARTGERYVTARRNLVEAGSPSADPAPIEDHGYRLRGGVHPETAAIANVAANLGVTAAHTGAPLSEAMVLGAGGGLGAGYILWEFQAHHARVLTLGFRNSWQYPDRWAAKTIERLGLRGEVLHTGRNQGRGRAARRGAGARAAGDRMDRPAAAGPLAPAVVPRGPRGLPHRDPRARRRALPRRRPQRRAPDRRAGHPGRRPRPDRLLPQPPGGDRTRRGHRRGPAARRGPRRAGGDGRAPEQALGLLLAAGVAQSGDGCSPTPATPRPGRRSSPIRPGSSARWSRPTRASSRSATREATCARCSPSSSTRRPCCWTAPTSPMSPSSTGPSPSCGTTWPRRRCP